MLSAKHGRVYCKFAGKWHYCQTFSIYPKNDLLGTLQSKLHKPNKGNMHVIKPSQSHMKWIVLLASWGFHQFRLTRQPKHCFKFCIIHNIIIPYCGLSMRLDPHDTCPYCQQYNIQSGYTLKPPTKTIYEFFFFILMYHYDALLWQCPGMPGEQKCKLTITKTHSPHCQTTGLHCSSRVLLHKTFTREKLGLF